MILFTNGCSWTWGGGLEPWFKKDNIADEELRKSLVWPNELGKLLNADKVVNLALGCGSNQRTVRTTFDWFVREYKNDEPIIAVIQITDPARYEYYVTDNVDDFSSEPLRWARITASAAVSDYESNYDFYKNVRRNTRLATYTTMEGMYKLVSECSALSYLFQKHNVEFYYFGGAFRFSPHYPLEYKQYLSALNYLDIENLWTYDRISKEDAHPSILGHKQLAECVYKTIRPSTNP